MIGRCSALVLAVALAAGAAQAQLLSEAVQSPILTLSQERLFLDTMIGKAAHLRFEEDTRLLQAENREIEAQLEAEERSLTERRPTLPPEEFRALAEAFDTKVEEIRTAQDAKSRDLTRKRDEDRQRLLAVAVPVLAGIMRELGAVAIVDKGAIVLSFDRIDITDTAIARMDAELGDGSASPAPPTEPSVPAPPATP